MRRVVFSEAARQDRGETTAYSMGEFGLENTQRLVEAFEEILGAIAEFPSMGRENPELDPAGFVFRYYVVVSRFIVVYRATPDEIQVARLLSGFGNFAKELERDSG